MARFFRKGISPNKLKNREFANAESHRFDSEKTSPLLDIGAVFSESKMRFSAKAKTDSSTCLGLHVREVTDPKEALAIAIECAAEENTLLLVTGTFFFMSAIRSALGFDESIDIYDLNSSLRQ